MNKKSQIAELFISFAITFYYFDILIRGLNNLLRVNSDSKLLLFDVLLYLAFTSVYVPISKNT